MTMHAVTEDQLTLALRTVQTQIDAEGCRRRIRVWQDEGTGCVYVYVSHLGVDRRAAAWWLLRFAAERAGVNVEVQRFHDWDEPPWLCVGRLC